MSENRFILIFTSSSTLYLDMNRIHHKPLAQFVYKGEEFFYQCHA